MASSAGSSSSSSIIVLDEDDPPPPPDPQTQAGPSNAPLSEPSGVPQANGGSGSKAALVGKDPASLRAENDRLFEEFITFCSQHTQEHPEVMPFLAGRRQKSSPEFLASVELCNVLGRCLRRVQEKRSKIYVYINELCTVFKAHSQKKQEPQPLASSAAPAEAPSGLPRPPHGGGSKRQIRHLENLLRVYTEEIRRLQERELDLEEMDSEDSAYLQESRLKRRMMRIFERLCQLKDCNSLTGRVIEQRIPYRGTRYPEVNHRIERLINRPEAFPDYGDILRVVQKACTRHSLGLPRRQMETMAADAFREVGNRLQERRHLDLVYNFGNHLTDQYRPGADPALTDSELSRRLRQNREMALHRLDQVMSQFAHLQDKSEEEEWHRKRAPSAQVGPTGHRQAEPDSAATTREGSPEGPKEAASWGEEEEEEEEEEESSSSEMDLEAELEEEEQQEESPVPDEEPPAQEAEADQRMDVENPELVLYSSAEELEDEEDDGEETEEGQREAAKQGPPGLPPLGSPPSQQFLLEIEAALPLEAGETPPPSPTEQDGTFPASRPEPKPQAAKRRRALENGGLRVPPVPAAQAVNGQPPGKRARRELRVSNSSCIEVPSSGSEEEDDEEAPPSPAPMADSTCADSPLLGLVSSSQDSPQPLPHLAGSICKNSVATQCDPEEIIVLSDSD